MKTHKVLIRRVLKDGHTVSVWDGEAWAVKRSTKYRAIVSACDGVDDVVRLLIRDNQGQKIGSVWVLDDNDPFTIIDHTDTPYLNKVISLLDEEGSSPSTHTKGNETMKHYISVTIGRNYGAKTREVENEWARNCPMSTDKWEEFQRTIKIILAQTCTGEGVVFDGSGKGTWAGVSEDAHTITIIASEYNSEKLRRKLCMAGGDFAQDAIALVVLPLPQGDETLIDCTE